MVRSCRHHPHRFVVDLTLHKLALFVVLTPRFTRAPEARNGGMAAGWNRLLGGEGLTAAEGAANKPAGVAQDLTNVIIGIAHTSRKRLQRCFPGFIDYGM